jgi:hypothetical protein
MKKLWCIFLVMTVAAVLFVLVGCETDSASEAHISVSPSSVELYKGGSQEFTAEKASGYKWSMAPAGYGTLSSSSGSRVTYTSTASVATTVVITVEARLFSSGGTNSTPTGLNLQSFASVTHLAD